MIIDKYHMTRKENIFYAKRTIVDNIYRSARLEGIAVTFPDTQMIVEGRSVAGLSVEEIIKINNLKHAWHFILESIDYPMDLLYIRQLNQEIGKSIVPNSDTLRMSDVRIEGTTWKPNIPDEIIVKKELDTILNIQNITDRSISLMLYLMRSQLFYDGNKRVAQLAANQIMIQNGAGLISIPVEQQDIFFKKLILYYESGKMEDIKDFIYNTSIDGIVMPDALTNSDLPDKNYFINYKKR